MKLLQELNEAAAVRGVETKAIRKALKAHNIIIDKDMQQYSDKRKSGRAAKIYIEKRPDDDTRKKITDEIVADIPGAKVTFGPGKRHHSYQVMRPWIRVATTRDLKESSDKFTQQEINAFKKFLDDGELPEALLDKLRDFYGADIPYGWQTGDDGTEDEWLFDRGETVIKDMKVNM